MRAHRQILEQSREIELPPAHVLDEALVQRRFVEMGVGVDEAGGYHHVASVDRLIDRLVPAFLGTDVNDRRCRQ